MNCIYLFAERWKREICFLEEHSATVCTVATEGFKPLTDECGVGTGEQHCFCFS